MLFPGYEASLIVAHFVTLVVLGIYGYKKDPTLSVVAVDAVLFAPAVFAYYDSDLWYHILICAAAALIGMLIGSRARVKR